MLHLSALQRAELAGHAAHGYPLEVCGLLIGVRGPARIEVRRVALARNLLAARDGFELAPQDLVAADRSARAEGLEIVGIWHSHPNASGRLSGADLSAAWAGWCQVVVAVDGAGAVALRAWRLDTKGRPRELPLA